MIIRLDEQNGGIDLSKKRVPKHKVKPMLDRYSKGQKVLTIMRAVRKKTGVSVRDLYEQVVWPLQDDGEYALTVLTQNLQ